ncbi:MAG: DUF1016 N-terminal domain-containing protein [Bacteroidales bacterium]|jgi:hypothetical protein|nr:DUF1016 N-terminal domain-containing protein [Bacteroidales bacterium]
MSNLLATEYQGFEQIKHIDESGNEYWFARELAPVLEYVEWRNFSKVIDRAMLACQNSGFTISDQFVEVSKLIEMPSKPNKIGFPDVEKTRFDLTESTHNEKSTKSTGLTLSNQLRWSHYHELLKYNSEEEISFYQQSTIRDNWSVRELRRHIDSDLFERIALSKDSKKIKELLEE